MVVFRPRRPVQQLAAAIGAALVERVSALRAVGAFKAADEGAGEFGRQVAAAALAVRAHLQHQAAACCTAEQIASTTCSTSVASSPSAMTRITGSVPEGRITSRPLPASCVSASAIWASMPSRSACWVQQGSQKWWQMGLRD